MGSFFNVGHYKLLDGQQTTGLSEEQVIVIVKVSGSYFKQFETSMCLLSECLKTFINMYSQDIGIRESLVNFHALL